VDVVRNEPGTVKRHSGNGKHHDLGERDDMIGRNDLTVGELQPPGRDFPRLRARHELDAELVKRRREGPLAPGRRRARAARSSGMTIRTAAVEPRSRSSSAARSASS
jgi:hypothetical protein